MQRREGRGQISIDQINRGGRGRLKREVSGHSSRADRGFDDSREIGDGAVSRIDTLFYGRRGDGNVDFPDIDDQKENEENGNDYDLPPLFESDEDDSDTDFDTLLGPIGSAICFLLRD